ncbi:MAG: hypothetical protein IJ433_02440 [Ruminococcus sp.]|nr:hypothetical protein [Ruminococcus sp.]
MNERKFKILEAVGVIVIYLIATLLHFVYNLSGGSTLSILFGAVNESVWEHVKIFAVGYVVWSLIELLWVKPPFKKFVTAKTVSLYFLSLSIIVFFYTYNLFTEEPILIVDLISSFIFVALSQFISFKLTASDNEIADYFPVAILLLMTYFVMFFSFTVFPPKVDLFKDPVTGMYGIIEDYIDTGAVFLSKNA